MRVDSLAKDCGGPVRPAETLAPTLLAWYDRRARRLPWRVPPGGGAADPYRVWLSEIMLQQTQVSAVAPRFERFVARWPTVNALASASEEAVLQEWAGLGYYARARNLMETARRVADERAGRFPATEEELGQLPGIGAYTAAAIAAIAFARRAVVVDANVERVIARLFALDRPLAQARPAIRAHADAVTPDLRAGDFAQAMMDLGALVCTPRSPACSVCPVADHCRARALGLADRLPAKAPRRVRPVRHGLAYWLQAEEQVLLVRRPRRGLLGGMLALPGSDWGLAPPDDVKDAGAPVEADWRPAACQLRHVFTHFELRLALRTARLERRPAVAGIWTPVEELGTVGLPALFRRAAELILRRC